MIRVRRNILFLKRCSRQLKQWLTGARPFWLAELI